ncbi:MAG TPA: 2-oxo acid dehydrogenase subunit E2 [Enteractinococcus helveticum]|uniref:Dihydrolipoamide acetyltransferase component of pyruvate dehydrogenase complex n=1 Tax=Enteractinococcus helveticum TaxID=1837282 RepID=A0A921FPU2_9MICC|nr:dihydrolipoamide acetyltransferase family protein [Enteractinococcus helveticum]HJF15715.1 2-oxo acid dehydrogenase subunit E2 [Enteractinococcus helveticum]
MTTEIKLPQWGMSMSEGTVTQWYVTVGDEVTQGQTLVEVEAAKVTDVVTAPAAGTVEEILVDVDETVEVNTVLCTIGDGAPAGEKLPQDEPKGEAKSAAGTTRTTAVETTAVEDLTETHPVTRDIEAARMHSGRVHGVVPLARKLAKEHGVDLTQLTGTGNQGRIVVKNVQAAIDVQDSAPTVPVKREEGTRQRVSRLRKVIAQRMHISLLETAQFTMITSADVTDFATMRSDIAGGATKPSFTDAVVRAVALALCNHPMLNSRLEDDTIVNRGEINVGLAVAIDDGLVVPVIRDADQLGLAEIAEATRDLANRARGNELGVDAFEAGTFTVTALGGQGVDFFTPIINPPQSAILGVGRVREVPARFGTGLMWRQELPLSLTVDHRINDGYPSALFLAEVVELLEESKQLV